MVHEIISAKKQFVICSFLSEFRTIGELEVIENNEYPNGAL